MCKSKFGVTGYYSFVIGGVSFVRVKNSRKILCKPVLNTYGRCIHSSQQIAETAEWMYLSPG